MTLPQTTAGRLEFAMDLFAPPMFDDDGNFVGRDESAGVISREQFLALVESENEAKR